MRSGGQVAGDISRQGTDDVRLTARSALQLYEERGQEARPVEPHPVTGKAFQSDEDWRQWCRRTSWWEWKQLVYVRSERNVFRAHFNARPKVVHVSPWLHFSTLGDPARYFTSCRHGLLAYCAFPNRHPHMGSASAIQELGDAAASALFESFVTADDAQRERWAWNSPPFFLPRAWRAAAAADARHVRAAQRKAKAQAKPGCQAAPVWDFGGEDPIPNHEPLPTAGRAPLAEQGQDRTQNAGGADGAALFTDAPHAEPNHNFQHAWEGLSAKAKNSWSEHGPTRNKRRPTSYPCSRMTTVLCCVALLKCGCVSKVGARGSSTTHLCRWAPPCHVGCPAGLTWTGCAPRVPTRKSCARQAAHSLLRGSKQRCTAYASELQGLRPNWSTAYVLPCVSQKH